MLHTNKRLKEDQTDSLNLAIFGADEGMPKNALNEKPIPAEAAYRLIKDELIDEGNARQNLATFCQTYMEPEATKLMAETLAVNAIDKSEYPQMTEVENRCVNIIADLWNAPEGEAMGTSTVGSSEACMLGGMAMKFRWRELAEKAGIDTKAKKPNLVISSGYQVCWEKFCVYWDIEMRLVPLDEQHMSLSLIHILGPEPFGTAADAGYLQAVCGTRKRAVKECLLDQSIIAGIGNIYADEILFASHIRPDKPARSLSEAEWKSLAKTIPERLNYFIEKNRVTPAEYLAGKGKKYRNTPFLQVYGRKGKPCPVCGAALCRIVIAGRGSVFCPHCQK